MDEERSDATVNTLLLAWRLQSALSRDETVSATSGLQWKSGLENERKKLKDGYQNRMSLIDRAKAEADWANALADSVLSQEGA